MKKILIKNIGEEKLINLIKNIARLRDKNIVANIGDDCAVVNNVAEKNKFLLLTTDSLVENVHFNLKYTSAFALGYKAGAVNISDIIAMGGVPKYLLISLGIPSALSVNFVSQLYKGLKKISNKYKVKIIGGDTVKSSKIFLSVFTLGCVEKNKTFYRNNAQAGDLIYCTNYLGNSSAGLYLLQNNKIKVNEEIKKYFTKKHLYPEPKAKEMHILKKYLNLNSLMDLSDGLYTDLPKFCAESKVGAKIFLNNLPVSKNLKLLCQKLKKNILKFALFGGEDYELLFTVPVQEKNKINYLTKKNIIKISWLGEITANKNIQYLPFQLLPLKIKPFKHF